MRTLPLVTIALLAAACAGDKTTFADVAPVLDAHCMQCHQAGGIAPQSFATYEETRPWADLIAAVTADRTMPPKQVTADGTCGDFVDPWWLGDADLATLAAWADDGAPEGPKVDRPEPPTPDTLADATHTVQTPVFFPAAVGTPDALNDEYRCFLVDLDTTSEQFLTGFDVLPGNSAIVHHVIGNVVDPTAQGFGTDLNNAELMQALDDASPDRLGWPCFNQAGGNDELGYVNIENDAVVWAPGQGAVRFPEGTGVAVPAGSKFVVQLHYNMVDPATAGQSDSTQVKLRLAEDVAKEAYVLYLETMIDDPLTPGFDPVSLPAGQDVAERTFSVKLEDILGVPLAINVIGVMPHMHARGRTLTDVLTHADGTETCLVDVPDWDYAWQFIYFYDEPMRIKPDDLWTMTCTYDTSDATEPVKGGWGTQNEMCLTVVYATL